MQRYFPEGCIFYKANGVSITHQSIVFKAKTDVKDRCEIHLYSIFYLMRDILSLDTNFYSNFSITRIDESKATVIVTEIQTVFKN